MESLENKLRRAMQRTDPPDGFADRVVMQLARKSPTKESPGSFVSVLLSWFYVPRWRIALPGVLALVFGVSLLVLRERQVTSHLEQERIRGEQTSARLLMALSITGAQLSKVHQFLAADPFSRQATEPMPAANPAAHRNL